MSTDNDKLKQVIQYYHAASISIHLENNYQKALDYYYMACNELDERGISKHKFNVVLLERIGDAYMHLGDDKALQYYVTALQTAIEVYGESVECAKISIKVADAFERENKFNEAFNCLCKSYEVMEATLGEDATETIEVMQKLSALHSKMQQANEEPRLIIPED